MAVVLADIPTPGGYLSLSKIIVMLLLATPWLLASPWVHKDAKRVRARQGVWSAAVLAAGAAGVLIWLLMPYYVVGLLFYLVLVGAILAAYVVYRNGRVEKDEKVLTAKHLASLFGRKPKVVKAVTRVRFYDFEGKAVMAPDESDVLIAKGYALAQDLLYDVLWRRASEAELTPGAPNARVRFVIDGVSVERPSLEVPQSEALIEYLKPVAGMKLEERRRPQQGKISVDLAGKPIDLELATAGTTGGQRLVVRIIQELVQTQLDGLGMSEDVLGRIRELNKQSGLILVAARPGNGLTSTLYSLLREHDAFTRQLVTLESKIKVDLENVTQNAYGEPGRLHAALGSALRQDPDVILVDQCLDPQSSELIRQAAAKKTVLLGVQAPDSFTALAKWVKLCSGDANLALPGVRAVLCQVLLRKLCPTCREAYVPDPRMLAKANIPAQRVDKFYQTPTEVRQDKDGNPIICPACQGSGYVGRTAAFELLEVTDDIRQFVAAVAPLPQIKAACRKNKMLYLQEQALLKVMSGLTSIQEVIRVTQQEKKS